MTIRDVSHAAEARRQWKPRAPSIASTRACRAAVHHLHRSLRGARLGTQEHSRVRTRAANRTSCRKPEVRRLNRTWRRSPASPSRSDHSPEPRPTPRRRCPRTSGTCGNGRISDYGWRHESPTRRFHTDNFLSACCSPLNSPGRWAEHCTRSQTSWQVPYSWSVTRTRPFAPSDVLPSWPLIRPRNSTISPRSF
jgi:hypothetical protein